MPPSKTLDELLSRQPNEAIEEQLEANKDIIKEIGCTRSDAYNRGILIVRDLLNIYQKRALTEGLNRYLKKYGFPS